MGRGVDLQGDDARMMTMTKGPLKEEEIEIRWAVCVTEMPFQGAALRKNLDETICLPSRSCLWLQFLATAAAA